MAYIEFPQLGIPDLNLNQNEVETLTLVHTTGVFKNVFPNFKINGSVMNKVETSGAN